MQKLLSKFKNLKWGNVLRGVIAFVVVISVVGITASLFSGGSGGSGGGRPTTSVPDIPSTPSIEGTFYYTLTFDANGGVGEMENQEVYLDNNNVANVDITENTFTHSSDGWYFAGWNTRADGSGMSYTDGQNINVGMNMTLYAQWAKDVSINYCKIYACDWESFYPPAENSGPVNKDGEPYYLRVTLDGQLLEGLGDYFTVDGTSSPVRTVQAKVGSKLNIQLINKGDKERGAVYVNDVKVEGNSKECYEIFEIPDTSEINITFTWETEGTTVTGDAQSYWICRIYYS